MHPDPLLPACNQAIWLLFSLGPHSELSFSLLTMAIEEPTPLQYSIKECAILLGRSASWGY
jgi:hypothetical protein